MKSVKFFQIAIVALLSLVGFVGARAQMCGGWEVRAAVVGADDKLIPNAALELINVQPPDDARRVKFQPTATNIKYNLVGFFYEGGKFSDKYEARISAPGYEEKIVSLPVEYCKTSFVANKYILEPSSGEQQRRRAEAATARNNLLQKMLTDAYAKGEFSGVVLAVKKDEIVFSGAVGKANRAWNISNQLSTKFKIASITKQFTAMLIMQLVEAGKIRLEGRIIDYLPDFRQYTGSSINVRNLLTSASGLPLLPDEFYTSEDERMTDANFVIKKYLQGDLLSVPGEKFNYNNADFIVLGAIIERVTGKSYEQNLREKILAPVGMKNSGLVQNESIIENLASGYSFVNGAFQNESFVQTQNFGAAGAMFSTAEDLLLWDKALMSYKLLSKKYTDEMFKPFDTLGYVALGSWSYQTKFRGAAKTIVERQGSINGFCALNLIVPEDNIAVVFLSNAETETLFQTYAGRGLSFEILNALLGK